MPNVKTQPAVPAAVERLRRMREAGEVEDPEPGDAEAIAEAWAEYRAGECMTTDELLATLDDPDDRDDDGDD